MQSIRLIRISIAKWQKYNSREDLKFPSWFRLQNRLFEDPLLMDLDNHHVCTWLYLLCERSKSNSVDYILNMRMACFILKISEDHLHKILNNLQTCGLISYEYGGLDADSTSTPRQLPESGNELHVNSTLQDKTRQDINTLPEIADAIPVSPEKIKNPKKESKQTEGSLFWKAYSEAFQKRYRSEPPRSAKNASICKRVVSDVGLDKALRIAIFYLEDDEQFLITNCHPLQFLPTRVQRYTVQIARQDDGDHVDDSTQTYGLKML